MQSIAFTRDQLRGDGESSRRVILSFTYASRPLVSDSAPDASRPAENPFGNDAGLSDILLASGYREEAGAVATMTGIEKEILLPGGVKSGWASPDSISADSSRQVPRTPIRALTLFKFWISAFRRM